MADILVEADFGQVRELLGVDAGELPDATISGFAYLEAAELDVKHRVTDWSDLLATADGEIRLKTAVAYLTAARLVTRQENRQRSGDVEGPFTLGRIDWAALRAHLESEAHAVIVALQPAVEDDDAPGVQVFTVAGISRRRRDRRIATGWCP